MKKMLLIMAMAALVCWLPRQALADTYASYLTYISDSHTGSGGLIFNSGNPLGKLVH
ncbi:MAG: hypothetical protein P8017_13300 [Deltaproteobacteria bacterium]